MNIVESKIKTDPNLRAMYEQLIAATRKLSPLIVEPHKSSVHLKAKTTFVGVHARKDHLLLQIVSDTPIEDPRITKVEKISKNRYHNHTRIVTIRDIDAKLGKWLKFAHALMS